MIELGTLMSVWPVIAIMRKRNTNLSQTWVVDTIAAKVRSSFFFESMRNFHLRTKASN